MQHTGQEREEGEIVCSMLNSIVSRSCHGLQRADGREEGGIVFSILNSIVSRGGNEGQDLEPLQWGGPATLCQFQGDGFQLLSQKRICRVGRLEDMGRELVSRDWTTAKGTKRARWRKREKKNKRREQRSTTG